MQLQHDVGSPPLNGVSWSSKEKHHPRDLHTTPMEEKHGDLNVNEKKMYQCGLKLFQKLQNESTVVDGCTYILIAAICSKKFWISFIRVV